MRLAKDGVPTISCLVFLTLAGFFMSPLIAGVFVVLTGFVIWFYRDPERVAPVAKEGEILFVSPADGKVVEIMPASHPFTGECTKVGIFMNVFSVHVNRAPCAGAVEYMEYIPGKKVAAFAPKASEINERNYVGLSTQDGNRVLMVQIAGLLARRIVCRLTRGQVLAAGERYGMIKLGSKVDIYLPKGVELSINLGNKVLAGKSVLGALVCQ
ncbi:phosphatidylserine decarboxylase proenzyme [Synergistales bacterium]|nr:phosphatidylserine decarboxylase proenzyme [Synergistales bacterium]